MPIEFTFEMSHIHFNVYRFHKEKSEGEKKFRNLFMLYYPWRNEDIDLKANFESFKEHFQHIQEIVVPMKPCLVRTLMKLPELMTI
jgi:hypothetical protein